ncbi:hypothetical protein NC652_029125 [Populus alba x Populus x berolinensis]|nr:hypothetical protein NC652_029125 [Populus alba x Populus x berolinensis]
MPTPSPLHVDEGGFSRRHPTREPSVAFASSSFFSSTSAAGGVTSGVVLEGCVGCRDSLSLSEFSLFVFFFFFGSWQLDRFVVDGYAVVWWFYCASRVGSVPAPSPLRVYEGSFSHRHPTRDVRSFCLPLLSFLFSRDFRRWWSYWRRGPGLLRWLPCSLESVEVVAFRVLFSPLLAAGSFRCYRLCRDLVVMLVTGSMAMLVLGVPWRICAGQLGFFLEGNENCLRGR